MADSYFLGSEVELKHVSGTLYEASGALVYFGNGLKDADFVKDFFAADTDYDLNPDGSGEATVYFNHGKDAVIGKNKLGHNQQKAKLSKDDRAVWISQHLDIANAYDSMVVELIQKRQAIGKNFGWSSGSVNHLVEREAQADGSMKIVKWPLGADASITLIPADWRQTLIPAAELKPTNAKSLLDMVSGSESEQSASSEAQEAEDVETSPSAKTETVTTNTDNKQSTKQTEVIVTDNPTQQEEDANVDETKMNDRLTTLESRMNENGERMDKILKIMEDAPRHMVGGYYTVDGGDADPNIKSVGDLAISIARKDLKRLKSVYGASKTQNTLTGSEGGFLVPETTLTDLGLDISLVSGLTARCRRVPVPTPSGRAPVRNYKTTPSGSGGASASASGSTSQKRKEGESYTKETVLLEELIYDVSDFASGYFKATRMQMSAAPMIEALLREAIEEDVANREEWAVLRGSGNGEPLGILNWDGRVEIEEDTSNTFVAADADEMTSHLLETGTMNIAWAYHNSIYTHVSPLARPDNAVSGNRGSAPMTSINGYPHMKTQHLPIIDNDGYIVLGDWNKYIIFEYEGLYINFSEHRYADESKVAWFFGKNIDGKPILPSAVTLADGSFELSPFVIIADKA